MQEFCSISEMAIKWKISHRRIQVLCVQNRVEGAMKIGTAGVIPANAKKPIDPRKK